MRTGKGLPALGLALLVAGCGTQSAADAGAGPSPVRTTPDFRVHADTLPPDGGLPTGKLPVTPAPGLSGLSVTPAPGASGRPGSPEEPCPEGGLRVTASGVDGAMGLRAVTVTAANCAAASVALDGYPLLRVLDAQGAPYDVTVHHGPSVPGSSAVPDPGPHRITLTAGQRATAVLIWRNTLTLSDDPNQNGAAVEVTPAAGRPPQTVPLHLDLGNTGVLDVTAWQRPTAAPGQDGRPGR
ncbi:DUF4232 domain-containing protein [Streptomyces sp. NBC_01476]|uniref:DUF4232 domain-containing protein n=1 Tax=Streptomyces sp. NBC_01476 TaxID=2903881 RepID=UPI002E3284A7|nr:DUF4232 domain-containing protein [Streptomyces sp. NBC_01476]